MPSAPIPAEQLPAGITAAWSLPPERKIEKKEEKKRGSQSKEEYHQSEDG
jgi:hypothetical protein